MMLIALMQRRHQAAAIDEHGSAHIVSDAFCWTTDRAAAHWNRSPNPSFDPKAMSDLAATADEHHARQAAHAPRRIWKCCGRAPDLRSQEKANRAVSRSIFSLAERNTA